MLIVGSPYFLNLSLLASLSSQECFQSGVDTDCTPVPAEGDAAHSFPMDASHGFGVVHEKVWDGSVEDPSTGLCQEGTPDGDGRFVNYFVSPALTLTYATDYRNSCLQTSEQKIFLYW